MPITADTAQRVALHTLGFDEFPPHIGGLELVNHAGEWLCSAHHWTFLDMAEASLAVTAGVEYALLPSDFQAIVAVAADHGPVGWTTVAAMVQLRSDGMAAQGLGFVVAVGHRQLAVDSAPTPVLELYPTPATTSAQALRLRYKRGWSPLTADHQRVALPGWMEPLYLESVRAFARGMLEEDRGTLSERLALVISSPLFAAAARRNASMQAEYGPLLGGAAQARALLNPHITITNP